MTNQLYQQPTHGPNLSNTIYRYDGFHFHKNMNKINQDNKQTMCIFSCMMLQITNTN